MEVCNRKACWLDFRNMGWRRIKNWIGRTNKKQSIDKQYFLKRIYLWYIFPIIWSVNFHINFAFEGLPLVIIEAMSCGVPVVSYACPCGPQDIIADGHDGFLVPVNNEKVLADRICRLIEDKELRKEMGKAARLKAEQYDIKISSLCGWNYLISLSTKKKMKKI